MSRSKLISASILTAFAIAALVPPAMASGHSKTYETLMKKFPPGADSVEMGSFALSGESRSCNQATGCGDWRPATHLDLVYRDLTVFWTYNQRSSEGPVRVDPPSERRVTFAMTKSGMPFVGLRFGRYTARPNHPEDQSTPYVVAVLSLDPSTEEFDLRSRGDFIGNSFLVDVSHRTPEERACHLEREGVGSRLFCRNALEYSGGSLVSEGVRIGYPVSAEVTDHSLVVHYQNRSESNGSGSYREARMTLRSDF